jgi:hypothetical protein
VFRSNSRLVRLIGEAGCEFVEHAASAISRILPHVELSNWGLIPWAETSSTWTDTNRRSIRVTIAVGTRDLPGAGALRASVVRRRVTVASQVAGQTLDQREYDICKAVIEQIAETMKIGLKHINHRLLTSLNQSFDEEVIARHIEKHHGLDMSIGDLFASLHLLSEQTYENKSLSFGCLIDPKASSPNTSAQFPSEFLNAKKKYKALSDGFRTAYRVSGDGHIIDFLDLQDFDAPSLTAHNIFPDWGLLLARASREMKCGIALSRQGDILVFDGGSLRFTHRHGRWQYWNHAHIINLLCDRAKAQRVPPRTVNSVIAAAYVAALDISFRRSGGLIVVLHNRRNLGKIVRAGDAISDKKNVAADADFDSLIEGKKIQSLSTRLVVELASLDGAVVVSNLGELLAYGSILNPRRAGRVNASEGSRTKAATGASNYGLAFKVSSDGGIEIFHKGKRFIEVSKS